MSKFVQSLDSKVWTPKLKMPKTDDLEFRTFYEIERATLTMRGIYVLLSKYAILLISVNLAS